MSQQNITIQNFDEALLEQLRAEVDVHNVDIGKAHISHLGGTSYSISFDKPVVDIDRFCPGAPLQLSARSAGQAEGLMLLWAKRIQVAERQAIRNGVVCGWDTAKINREPITATEMDRYRARLKEAELQRKIAAELKEAVELREREVERAEAVDLSQRYPGTVVAARKKKTPVDVPGPVASLKGKSK
ncbi:hypothetical protein HWD96_07850 [Pseudomonas putida]|uniref:hypothetical protein n=1 Tax=Pseudomonas putida TaxID=303 RepID=UPI001F525E74|nr:hypothetical protein [Pseudomonas putida]MCI1022142.1 hypothetical protein [Pseudomonas putida]